jgi:hypothetical protein
MVHIAGDNKDVLDKAREALEYFEQSGGVADAESTF